MIIMFDIEDFLKPKVIGKINAVGPWDGSGCVRDVFTDILDAVALLPGYDEPMNLITNRSTNCYLYGLDYDSNPMYISVLRAFGIRKCDYDAVRNHVIRIDPNIPNNTALVVSTRNNIIMIHTGSQKHVTLGCTSPIQDHMIFSDSGSHAYSSDVMIAAPDTFRYDEK